MNTIKNTGYMPVCLDVQKGQCLVVGGGNVALRKITALRRFGASITCISPEFIKPVETLARMKKIKCIKGPYPQRMSLKKYTMVVAATDNPAVNKRIAGDATRDRALVNVVDKSAPGTVIMPAVLKRRGLTIAVSTNGQRPARAKKIRDILANVI